jgi:hypothetical protein
MKRLVAPNTVLVVGSPRVRTFLPGYGLRPFNFHNLGLVGGPPYFITWSVQLQDGYTYGYSYDVAGDFGQLALRQHALNKAMGATVGGLNGGELFNFSTRPFCVFKVKV